MDRILLHTFFEGKATPEEKEIVRVWLDESETHRKELFTEREFFDALILSDKKKSVRPNLSKKSLFRSTVVREVLKIASVIVITALIGSFIYIRKMDEISQAVHTVVVPEGQRANVRLSDGTNVWLNARSTMTYPAYFSGSVREIQLDGEAYLEVEGDIRQPFIVRTKHYDVKVLGTRFNIEAYADSDDFSTAVMEGSVKITTLEKPDECVALSSNQKAVSENGLLVVSLIADNDIYRWREGLICFKDANFLDLTKQFEKNYGIRIVVENKGLGTKVFSGKFRVSDGIDNALRILQKEGDYTFERDKDDSVIYIK